MLLDPSYLMFLLVAALILLLAFMPLSLGFGNRCRAQNGCAKWWSREQVSKHELTRHLSPATEDKREQFVVRYLSVSECKHGCGRWQREITVREDA